jgi:hypothetical protein
MAYLYVIADKDGDLDADTWSTEESVYEEGSAWNKFCDKWNLPTELDARRCGMETGRYSFVVMAGRAGFEVKKFLISDEVIAQAAKSLTPDSKHGYISGYYYGTLPATTEIIITSPVKIDGIGWQDSDGQRHEVSFEAVPVEPGMHNLKDIVPAEIWESIPAERRDSTLVRTRTEDSK